MKQKKNEESLSKAKEKKNDSKEQDNLVISEKSKIKATKAGEGDNLDHLSLKSRISHSSEQN